MGGKKKSVKPAKSEEAAEEVRTPEVARNEEPEPELKSAKA